jgi:general secretion pathway protein M
MKSLSPAASRIIALALLAAAIALPWRLLVQPLQATFSEYEDAVAGRQDVLARYQRLADSRAALRARLEELQQEPASQEGYLTGDSETLVAAELQNLVRTTVERSGGRLESTQILPAVPEGAFRRVTLRVRMSADTDGLFRILYDLESSLPYLFLDSLDIVSRDRRAARGPQGQVQGGALSVSYDVFGYMRAS